MSPTIRMTRLLPILSVAASLGVAAAGCSREVSEATGFATTTQEAKPFVRETRPASTEYIPVGTSAVRQAPRKQVTEFKSIEAELEAKRISNEAAGAQARQLGATPPPAPAPVQ